MKDVTRRDAHWRRRCWIFGVLVSTLACGRGDSTRNRDEKREPTPKVSSAAGVTAPAVVVTVDGAAVASVGGDVVGGVAGSAQLPLPHALGPEVPTFDQWQRVEAKGKGRTLSVTLAKYTGYQLRLYIDASGPLSIGLFRRQSEAAGTKASATRPVRSLIGLEQIGITTKKGAAAEAHIEASLKVTRGGKTNDIPLSKLNSLRSTKWRESKRNKEGTSAWRVSDVVGLTGAMASVTGLRITDRKGQVAAIQKQWLSGRALRIKLSGSANAGMFNVKHVSKAGKTDFRVRDVVRIDVLE